MSGPVSEGDVLGVQRVTGKGELSGMRGFIVVWAGQFVSLLGTGMAAFGLTIWAWQMTGSATALAMVGLFTFAPTVLLSPLAGALVDRWNRKWVIIMSDTAAGFAALVVLILMSAGKLQVWHLYATGAFTGAFQAFQFPAYSAAVSTMISKQHYGRASGMVALADSASAIIAPAATGVFLSVIGITGILLIDVTTFIIAIGALLLSRIPSPLDTAATAAKRSLLKDSVYGFRYIHERPSLLGLLLLFLVFNLITGFCFPLLAPMILARSGGSTLVLGSVQAAFGAGGLVGGALMTAWGGPKRKVYGVLGAWAFVGLFGITTMGLGREPMVWSIAAFSTMLAVPIANGCSQAIWQAKVPPGVQGRVFATRRLIAQISSPIAMGLAGPLADAVFGPAMMQNGWLAPSLGWLIGVGPGAGVSLIFVIAGLISSAAAVLAFSWRAVREVQETVPDHDLAEAPLPKRL